MHCGLKATIYTNKANIPAQMHYDLQANGYAATKLMSRLICNLPELNKGFAIRLLHIANLYV